MRTRYRYVPQTAEVVITAEVVMPFLSDDETQRVIKRMEEAVGVNEPAERLRPSEEARVAAALRLANANEPQRRGGGTLHEIFAYHPPTEKQLSQFNAIRSAALNFALIVTMNTPDCADQTAAIRKIREAVMTANAAIALDGAV